MDSEIRDLTPRVLAALVRRGVDFATGEDAVQEALVRAVSAWHERPPADPAGWLVTVAWRIAIDIGRSDTARRRRELRVGNEPSPAEVSTDDDSLALFFLCAHPSLTPASAIALTLRAVGGLSTRQIAQAYLVPEATMAQRISRAKRTVAEVGLAGPGDVRWVMRTLYLVFNEGYGGEVDLAAEAIRLTRMLATLCRSEGVHDPEVDGLLALMLLHHARRATRTTPGGELISLSDQDRSRWDQQAIQEGVELLQRALARDRLGEYQAQAAIAALHADARSFVETDWTQIVEWYDELLALAPSDVVRLNRLVALGEAGGPSDALAELALIDPSTPRLDAVAAHLHELDGDLAAATAR